MAATTSQTEQSRPSLSHVLLKTQSILSNSSSNSDHQRNLQGDVRAIKQELGNWWGSKHRGQLSTTPRAGRLQTTAMARSVSDSNFSPRSNPPAPAPAPASNPGAATENAPPTSPTSAMAPPSDNSREHLYYRDHAPYKVYPKATEDKRRHSFGSQDKLSAEDQKNLQYALEMSQRETDDMREKAKREDWELQRALAESSKIARTTSSSDEEHTALSRAILESQRQVILDQKRRRDLERNNGLNDRSLNRMPGRSHDAPPSLEESEWIIQSRNEKGGLWAEAGAHGWLPPGAGRPTDNESEEQKLIELAIRISLEEQEARRAAGLESPELERGDDLDSQTHSASSGWTSYANAMNSGSGDLPRRDYTKPLTPPQVLPTSPLQKPKSNQSPYFANALRQESIPPSLRPGHIPSSQVKAHTAPPSRAPPPPPLDSHPTTSTYESAQTTIDRSETGSPLEMPYLVSTSSSDHLDLLSRGNSSASKHSHLSRSGGSEAHEDFQPLSPGNRSPTFFASPSMIPFPSADSPERSASPESLEVRNPDENVNPTHQDTRQGLGIPTRPTYDSFYNMAGRSMSLISEHTEPSTTLESRNSGSEEWNAIDEARERMAQQSPQTFGRPASVQDTDGLAARLYDEMDDDDGRTISPTPSEGTASGAVSSSASSHHNAQNQEYGNLPVLNSGLSALQRSQEGEVVNGSELGVGNEVADSEHDRRDPSVAGSAGERRSMYGNGVRYGYPSMCARDHACSMDGLHSESPFPGEVTLSTFGEEDEGEERSRYAVEAKTWVALLRFLMWYGETTIKAARQDIQADDSHHCDACLTLEFRKDDEGQGVLRLVIEILPPNHLPVNNDLEVFEPSSPGKGKAKATLGSGIQPKTFSLPDHVVLPVRLSTIAISLYSLRHLGSVALSSQPSKDASSSFHALRSLALAIQALSREHGHDTGSPSTKRDEERLLGKLRARLAKIKRASTGSGMGGAVTGGAGGSGARLLKPPPLNSSTQEVNDGQRVQVAPQRTQTVPRASRVLSNYDADSLPDESRYLPTLAMR